MGLVSAFLKIQAALDNFPVDNFPQTFDVLGSAIEIVEVVCVLPYVYSVQGCHSLPYRAVAVRTTDDAQFAAFFLCQPHPAAAEERACGFFHLFFECVEVPEVEVYELFEVSAGQVACGRVRGELLEV